MSAQNADGKITEESFLIEKYCVSRHQARRLLNTFGHDRAELEHLLGASGRTEDHRPEDVDQTEMDVAFG